MSRTDHGRPMRRFVEPQREVMRRAAYNGGRCAIPGREPRLLAGAHELVREGVYLRSLGTHRAAGETYETFVTTEAVDLRALRES